jgi:hypothetical protein
MEDLNSAFNKLESQVKQIVKNDENVIKKIGLPKINIHYSYVFIMVFLFVLLIVLLIWKPKFISENETKLNGEIVKKISLKKVLILVLILVFCAVSFFYIKNNIL